MGPLSLERRFDRFRRKGDPAALAAVFDATAPEILKVASHLASDPAAAEDLLQRTFLTAIEAAPTWDRSRRLLPWLLGILANHAKEASRRAARTPDPARLPSRESEGPVEAAGRREGTEAAGRAIDELHDPARSILVLRYRHGLEPAEIALALGMPPATVRSHLHRGIERVRKSVPGALVAISGPEIATKGLEGVRRVVVVRASAAGADLAAAVGAGMSGFVIGGILVGKKAIVLAAGLLLLLGGTSYLIVAPDGGGDGAKRGGPVPAADRERREATLAAREPTAVPRAAKGPAPEAAITDPTKGALELRVLARDGAAIPDEPYAIAPGGDPMRLGYRFARTGADGVGRIDGLEPGQTLVSSGHGPRKYVEIPAGGVAHMEIRLARGIDVEGMVVDPAGSPVVGAEVWIDREMTRSYGMMAVTRTKADGRFAIQDVYSNASVSARAVGFAPSPCRRLLLGEGKTENVRLVLGGPGASVHGRVEDAEKAPVAGAFILIGYPHGQPKDLPDGTQGTEALPFLLSTAVDGTFAADGLPVGKAFVTVRARSLGAYRADRELAADPAVNEWKITLSAGAVVEGLVVDAAGKPVDGATVTSGNSWDSAWFWRTTTDAQGRYRFDDLPPNQAISFNAAHAVKGHGSLSGGGNASPPDSVARIVLQPYVQIRVRVIDERGDPVVDRNVSARTPIYPGGKTWKRTDSDGRVTLDVGVEDTYEVYVTDPEGDDSQPSARLRGVHPGPDEVTFTLREKDRPTAKIVGRVVIPGGQLPDGALVYVMPFAQSVGLNLSLDVASGRFESKLIQPGRYEVNLNAVGMGAVPLGLVRVDVGQTLDLGEIRLDPPGSLVVKVIGGEDLLRSRPYLGAEGVRGRVGARSEPDGTARFAFLSPGRYQVRLDGRPWGASPTAAAVASVLIESGREASLELTTVRGHVRKIRAEGLGADDVPGLTIEVRAEADGSVLARARFGGAMLSKIDLSVESAFAPGRYVADAELGDGRKASVTFEVRGDGEPPVVLAGFK